MRIGVVLLAAGSGRRFGHSRPKQFISFRGHPLYLSSLMTFSSISKVTELVLAVPRKDISAVEKQLYIHFGQQQKQWLSGPRPRRDIKRFRVVEGGAFRGESVRNGVRCLSSEVDVILVHDAARPLVDRDTILRVATAAQQHGAALAAWPLADTLKLATKQDCVRKTVPRDHLWLAQTPQGFRRDLGLTCLMRPSSRATDDVALAERRGVRAKLVKASPLNIKVTTPHDLALCEALHP